MKDQSNCSLHQAQNQEVKIPNDQKCKEAALYEIIAKSFETSKGDNNKIIFFSKSINVNKSLAHSLLAHQESINSFNQIVLLIDFDICEIKDINVQISHLILDNPKMCHLRNEPVEIKSLKQMGIQMRKVAYLTMGIYSISSQIFLTDLMRGQGIIHPRIISKIIIKLTDKIKDHYDYIAWIVTHLKLLSQQHQQKSNCSVICFTMTPYHYSQQKELENIYRILFCKKIIIWPFGRSEIHSRLTHYRSQTQIKQFEHRLPHTQNQKQIFQLLENLLHFLKKIYKNKYDKEFNIEDIVFLPPQRQYKKHEMLRKQVDEFCSIRTLLILLTNCNKVRMLQYMQISSSEQTETETIWKSNNSCVIDILQKLMFLIRTQIFQYNKVESDKKVCVELETLVNGNQPAEDDQNQKQTDQNIKNEYQLSYNLELQLRENRKIEQLINIIEKKWEQGKQVEINQKKPQSQGSALNDVDDELIEFQRRMDDEQSERSIGVLVVTENNLVTRYVHKKVHEHLSESCYIEHLRELKCLLQNQKPERMATIKKILEKLKKEKNKNLNQQTNSILSKDKLNKPKKVKVASTGEILEENKSILEELLFQEICKVLNLIDSFEIQREIKNQQNQEEKTVNYIFRKNENDEIFSKQFDKSLEKLNLRLLRGDKIKLSAIYRSTKDLIMKNSNGFQYRVVVQHFKPENMTTQFNTILRAINPEIIIFYTPNSPLLRNLYLYQMENLNYSLLNSIHILNFEESFESKSVAYQITKQDTAFWHIAQNRAQLHEFSESPFSRIQNLNFHDQNEKARTELKAKSFLNNDRQKEGLNLLTIDLKRLGRTILVDTREFKSKLPSYLYHYGFTIIPIFLSIGDYILSDDVAVQKKAVHTKDLQQSLKSGRLKNQLQRMNSKFKLCYLLIECEDIQDCHRNSFYSLESNKINRSRFQLRKELIQMVMRFQNVKLIWSSSVIKSCQFFKLLKTNKHEPDVSKFKNQEQTVIESDNSKAFISQSQPQAS